MIKQNRFMSIQLRQPDSETPSVIIKRVGREVTPSYGLSYPILEHCWFNPTPASLRRVERVMQKLRAKARKA